jgi:hypothetical protein
MKEITSERKEVDTMPKLNLSLDMSLLGCCDALSVLEEDDRDWLDVDLVDEENEGEPIPLEDIIILNGSGILGGNHND